MALSEMEAYALFTCQQLHPADQCRQSSTASNAIVATQQMVNTPGEIVEARISVYPNPTSGDVYLKIPAEWGKGTIVCTLFDIQGKALYTRAVPAGKVMQMIRLDNIRSAAVHDKDVSPFLNSLPGLPTPL